jgi:hypothetical protein
MLPLHPRDLTGQITRDGRYPFACGAFGDVYKATLHMKENKCLVRNLRFIQQDGLQTNVFQVAVKVLLPRTSNEEDRHKLSIVRNYAIWYLAVL